MQRATPLSPQQCVTDATLLIRGSNHPQKVPAKPSSGRYTVAGEVIAAVTLYTEKRLLIDIKPLFLL